MFWVTSVVGPLDLLGDANGKVIKDPRTAFRKYKELDYDKYCSAFCVKDRGIKVGKRYPKVWIGYCLNLEHHLRQRIYQTYPKHLA